MSDKLPFVVTISRQLGSGRSYLGQRIAGSPRHASFYADREIIRQAAGMLYGSKEVEQPTDEKTTPLWESLLRTFHRGEPESALCRPWISRRPMMSSVSRNPR